MKHILKNHEANLVDRGVVKEDIPKLLDKTLKSKTIKRGVGKKGPYGNCKVNGKEYRVAHGDNGVIVALYQEEK
ncbi:hypothetical protein BIZ31_01615 [Lactiplantibacillus plantarum]|nr:hypothetical protein BIZ31_01615 [Lactiplantibacillus plantarum]ARO02702.1 hypothetical protein BIZ32_01615 [Lactiplantibacillus plantarum]